MFQLITYVDDKYLIGEIRSNHPLCHKYHIRVENEYFSHEIDGVYRNSEIYKEIIDKKTGKMISKTMIKKNHAKVLYDTTGIITV